MIYFVEAISIKAIKIGYTKKINNLKDRLWALKWPFVDGPEVLGIIPGDRKIERSMHARFKHLHLNGEWFEPSDDLINFIATNPKRIEGIDLRANGDNRDEIKNGKKVVISMRLDFPTTQRLRIMAKSKKQTLSSLCNDLLKIVEDAKKQEKAKP